MKYLLLIFVSTLVMFSCIDDDDKGSQVSLTICNGEILNFSERINDVNLVVSDWPSEIRMYVSTELAGFSLVDILQFNNSTGITFYLVELDGQRVLLFDESFNFICAEGDFNAKDEDEDIAIENLPQAILDYIENNYPGAEIDEAEFEDGGYEIELNNDIELCFDVVGNFIDEC